MEININGIVMRNTFIHPNYFISKDGEHVYNNKKNNGCFLKLSNVNGYKKVNYMDGKRNIGVHILVWEAWVGPIPKGSEIHHKDKSPSNNNLSNLKCLTKKEHLELHKNDQISKQRRHESRLGRPSGMKGKKHSPETINKMKQTAKNRKRDGNTGRFINRINACQKDFSDV